MKKNILSFLGAIILLVVLYIPSVHAQDFSYRIPNPSRYENLEDILSALASLIRPLFILAFGGYVLYGAWVRLTAKGDADKVASSTKIIIGAATGFSIAVLAPTVVNLVTGLLGVEGISGL